MSKAIPLSNGGEAWVDDEDFDRLSRWTWRRDSNGYARRSSHGRTYYLAREVMDAPEGMQVDHIDRDPLNNRRANLRLCTNRENSFNQRSSHGASQFKGVTPYGKGRWQAQIKVNYESRILGQFDSEEEAARAYDRAALEHFGPEFAALNFPEKEDASAVEESLPLEVEPLVEVFDDGEMGNQFGYWTRGHHDPEAFVEGCDYYSGDNSDEHWLRYYEPMAPEHVRHVYWRTVPIKVLGGGVEGFRFVEANGSKRGAFPATVLEYVRRATTEPEEAGDE